jgi:hypothetical protein
MMKSFIIGSLHQTILGDRIKVDNIQEIRTQFYSENLMVIDSFGDFCTGGKIILK